MPDNRILSSSAEGTAGETAGSQRVASGQQAALTRRARRWYNVSTRYRRLEHVSETSLLYVCFVDLAYLVAVLVSIAATFFVLLVCLPLGALVRYSVLAASCLRYRMVTSSTSTSATSGSGAWQLASATEEIWLSACTAAEQCPSQTLLMLQTPVCVDDLRVCMHDRLIAARMTSSDRLKYPRFTQRIERLSGGDAIWVADERFTMDNHVYEHNGGAPLASLLALRAHVSTLAGVPLSTRRPLWEMQLVRYLDDQHQLQHHTFTEDAGLVCRCCILLRLHPALGDGASIVHVFTQVLGECTSVDNSVSRRCLADCAKGWRYIRSFFAGFLTCMNQWVFRWQDRSDLTNSVVSSSRDNGRTVGVAWSRAISLEKVNRIRQLTRTTVTDVLLAFATQVLARHLHREHLGSIVHVHATLPMDIRARKLDTNSASPASMTSSYAFVDVLLPTDIEGIIPKLWHLKTRGDALKASSVPLTMHCVTRILRTIFPACIYGRVYRRLLAHSSCFVSSLKSVEARVSIASSIVTSVVCFVPPPMRRSRLSITFFTYADDIHFAVMADYAVVPSPQLLTDDFTSQIDTLYNMLSFRRVPGDHSQHSLPFVPSVPPAMSLNERALAEIRAKLTAVQSELQSLKSRIEGVPSADHTFSLERHAVVSKVQQLKTEFSKLLLELRRKQGTASTSASSSSTSHIIVNELTADNHLHEDTSFETSLVQRRTLTLEASPVVLGELDFIDQTPELPDVEQLAGAFSDIELPSTNSTHIVEIDD